MPKTLVVSSFALALFLAASVAFAQEQNIAFPVAELGGCESKEQCKAYCDNPAHIEACVSFAEAHGLMSSDEAAQARKFAGQTGPGGCMGSECRRYCADATHREECVQFAKEHNLTSPGGLRPDIEHLEIDEPQIDEERAMKVVEEK